MILFALLVVLLYQGSVMSNDLPQQSLLLLFLLLIGNHSKPNITCDNYTNSEVIIPEADIDVKSYPYSEMNICSNEMVQSDNYVRYGSQKIDDDIKEDDSLNNNLDERTYYKTNGGRNHYYDTNIYHNKKRQSGNDKNKINNTDDKTSNSSDLNDNMKIKTHDKTVVHDKKTYTIDNQSDDKEIHHNKMILSEKNKDNKALKESKEESKNSLAENIKKKYSGKTISIILGSFGMLTGDVIFTDNKVTGLKLKNGVIIYINNKNITSYF